MKVWLAPLSAVLLLAGCVGTPVVDYDVSGVLELPPGARVGRLERPSRELNGELTMREAVETALAWNPEARAATYEAAAATAQVEEALAGFLPTIDLEGGYFRRDNRQGTVVSMDTGLPPPAPATIEQTMYMGEKGNWNWQARMTVVLWSGGALSAGYRSARWGLDAARASAVGTRRAIVREVKGAFVAALLAERRTEVAQKALVAVREALEQVRALAVEGMAVRGDILALEAAEADARASALAAADDAAVARERLCQVMGVRLGERLRLVEPTVETPDILEQDRLAEVALSRNPSLRAMYAQVRSLKEALNATAAAAYPKLVTIGSGNYINDDTLANPGYWGIQLGISWTPFSGFSTRAQTRRMSRQIAALEARLSAAAEGLRVAIKAQVAAVKNAARRLEAAVLRRASLDEAARVARARLEAGAGTGAEVAHAEAEAAAARMGVVAARLNVALAVAALEESLGCTMEAARSARAGAGAREQVRRSRRLEGVGE